MVNPAANIPDLVARRDVILTSLPSSEAFVHVAEFEILPNTARTGGDRPGHRYPA
jgi:hypothetical protein